MYEGEPPPMPPTSSAAAPRPPPEPGGRGPRAAIRRPWCWAPGRWARRWRPTWWRGLEVTLLDMVPPGAGRPQRAGARGRCETLKTLKPSPLHLPEHADRIRAGNFEDDWRSCKDADWVFEAVVEDLEVKRQLFARGGRRPSPQTRARHQQHLGPGHRRHVGARCPRTCARASSARTSSTRRAT